MKSKIFSEILSEVTPEIESKVEQKTNKIMKAEFKQYKRSQIAEMREVKEGDINSYENHGFLHISSEPFGNNVSISDADKQNGSPKIGDMIARNPKNHSDQWLVAEQYFKDNFEEI